ERIDEFLALVPAGDCAGLNAFANRVVAEFDPFRAPLSEAEIERRSAAGLTASEQAHLERWGYPYVFSDFRFHMTLTGRLPIDESAQVEQAAQAHFGTVLAGPMQIASLALFAEPERNAPFHVRSFHS